MAQLKRNYKAITAALANHNLDASEIFEDGWDQHGYYAKVRSMDGKLVMHPFESGYLMREWRQWPSQQAFLDFYAAFICAPLSAYTVVD